VSPVTVLAEARLVVVPVIVVSESSLTAHHPVSLVYVCCWSQTHAWSVAFASHVSLHGRGMMHGKVYHGAQRR